MEWPWPPCHLPVISSLSRECLGAELQMFNAGALASSQTFVVNTCVYQPLAIRSPFLVRKFWWANGATAAGNVDAGIYSVGGARLASTGSTAQSGTNVIQSAAPSGGSLLLTPGSYVLGLGWSLTTTSFMALANTLARCKETFGCCHQGSTFPLPDPMTRATATSVTQSFLWGIADVATI